MKITNAIIAEPQLVARLQAQDISAFCYLYDNYSPALYGLVLRIVKKEEVAEEVLHDVFIKIWDSIGQYTSSRGRLFSWMHKLARNLSIDRLRSKEMKRELKTDAVAENLFSIDIKYYDHQQIDSIGIERLLNSLKKEQYLIIKLLYLQGYTISEVTKEYGIPLGTVKSRHRMAMIHLRKLLAKEL